MVWTISPYVGFQTNLRELAVPGHARRRGVAGCVPVHQSFVLADDLRKEETGSMETIEEDLLEEDLLEEDLLEDDDEASVVGE